MCRLFAFVAPDRSTTHDELGPEGLESLLSLARLHGDGWGWAGVDRLGQAPVVVKSAQSAATDPEFDEALSTAARAAMVHLRWATSGLPVADGNAHPFRAGDLAFEHNGSLKPLGALRALLSPESIAGLTGDTDSEMYFALIREQIARGLSPAEAVVEAVRGLREQFPLASLNALLLTPDELIAVHASASSALTDDDRSRMAAIACELPAEHNEDYFALRRRDSPDGTISIGSTGVAGEGWMPLPAESVTVIRLDDRTALTMSIETAGVVHR